MKDLIDQFMGQEVSRCLSPSAPKISLLLSLNCQHGGDHAQGSRTTQTVLRFSPNNVGIQSI
jgi:hypothetical protein